MINTDNLIDGQEVIINTARKSGLKATVHRGEYRTKTGEYFYLMPIGESHPGAAITKNEIIEITGHE